MRKRIALGAAVLLIAGVMASLPANAEPKAGWFVFLEGVDTQVTDTSQSTGIFGTFGDPFPIPPNPSTPTTLDHRFVDWDSNITGRIGFGKQWSNGNKLTVSYWMYDNDEDGSADLAGVDYFYSPFGYYYYDRTPSGVGGAFATFTRHEANVKASSIDVDFAHVHSVSDNFDFEWNLGLKFAQYEDSVAVDYGYVYTYPDTTTYQYFLTDASTNDSDMWGFKAGARGSYNFGARFSLTAGLNIAKVMGDLESTSALDLTTIDGAGTVTNFNIFEDSATDDNRSGTIADYDIMGVFHLGEHFDLGVGYEHSTWDGIATDLMRSHWELPAREGVGFSGWKLGVKWRFGGG